MDKDTIPVLILVVIVFIIGFFVISSQTSKERKAEITDEATISNSYSTEEQSMATGSANEKQNLVQAAGDEGPTMQIDENKKYTAVMNTTEGTIKLELNALQTPITVNNFVTLAKAGFYNDTIFHRVIDGFMIQGGDPEGTGRGGPGYRFIDEPFEGEYTRGTLAMANAGPDTNGSQFFIMHKDYGLSPDYTIFGKVTEGIEVVDKIATAKTTMGGDGANSKPINPVKITSIEIIEE